MSVLVLAAAQSTSLLPDFTAYRERERLLATPDLDVVFPYDEAHAKTGLLAIVPRAETELPAAPLKASASPKFPWPLRTA
jgi:hypothetical protein